VDGSTRSGGSHIPHRARPISIQFERLANNGKLVWNTSERQLQSRHALHVLVGAGRGCMLHSDAMPATVIMPLRGRVRLADAETERILEPGQLFVCEAGQRMQAVGGVGSLWVALIAPAPVWRQLLAATAEPPIPDPIFLPALHVAERSIRRVAVQLARHARTECDTPDVLTAALRFTTMLVDLQAQFHPLIARCPGRTLAHRRGVFLRLHRVHNHMESSSDLDLGVAGFASMANYSPCHFVRTFTTVYGQTPHAVLIEQRLKLALRLVSNTELSITEVARASGFEDRCAFARSFKRRFGKAASMMREHAQPT
jgi:AraC family transcriptional regulator